MFRQDRFLRPILFTVPPSCCQSANASIFPHAQRSDSSRASHPHDHGATMQLHQADPHDAIAAQLRALSTSHASDPPGSDVTPAASPEPASEPPLRATPLNDNTGDMRILRSRARSGRKVVFLAICAGIAATMAWHAYGDQAKQKFSSLLPQLFANAPAPTQSANAAEPPVATSQVTASQPATETPAPALAQENSNVTSEAPAPAAPTPAAPVAEPAPTQAALPPEVAQSLDTMVQEIASLKQTVEQLRASQQQLSNDVAKLSEQAARHKLTEQPKPASRPRPRHSSTPAAASRTPAASHTLASTPPPQSPSQRQISPQAPAQREAYIPPPAPARLPPPPGDSSVPRPPMPLQ
ncbi:MAG: hypothetical protein J0H71_15965 [Rhizobiales bacterium]|nr:hypothetical protein [Hyphomicrobiales bacterium]